MFSDEQKKNIRSIPRSDMGIERGEGVYLGNRGEDFKQFITTLLKIGKIKDRYIHMLTDAESMNVYACAFTSELVDPDNNYQVLEQIGDLSGNKIIVNYMYEKFPQLDCTEGVKVVARLRINYGAKQCFSEIARKLGFWEFISATIDLRNRKMKSLLEDVFEAFLGATERIVDKRKRVGVGYAIVYDILASIFDTMDISLKYEDLYDSKTRLKELFDTYESSLGSIEYKDQKTDLINISSIYRVVKDTKKRVKIGEGSATLKADAQQNASAVALVTLAKEGWIKNIPKIYNKFNIHSDNTVDCHEKIVFTDNIDELVYNKEKNKYQSKYQSTQLSYCCRKRYVNGVSECVSLGADPNIEDSEGMFSTDLLFIGKINEQIVEKIISILTLKNIKLKIHKVVFNMYVNDYINKYIEHLVIIE